MEEEFRARDQGLDSGYSIKLQKLAAKEGWKWGKGGNRIAKLQRTAQFRQQLLEARSKLPDTAGEELFELLQMKDNAEALRITVLCTVQLGSTVKLYCTVLYCIALYCTVRTVQ